MQRSHCSLAASVDLPQPATPTSSSRAIPQPDLTPSTGAATLAQRREARHKRKREPPTFQYASNEDEGLWIPAAAYDLNLQGIRNQLAAISNNAKAIVPEEEWQKPVFEHLVRSAEKAAKCPNKRKRTIYLIGESGAGKSSTINCILGLPKLAAAFGLAESVTFFPTKYKSNFAGQTKNFQARIECNSMNETRSKFRGLWRDYRSWELEEKDMKDKDKLAKATQAEDDHYDVFAMRNAKREAAKSAFEVLRAIFCERKEFETKESGESFLRKAVEDLSKAPEDLEKDIVNTFAAWTQEILDRLPIEMLPSKIRSKKGPGDRIPMLKFESDSQEEFQKQLNTYACCDSQYAEASLWPLITMVHVGIRGVPILRHAIFVDWPGSGDTNNFRAKASTGCAADCDEIWIICNVGRFSTNKTLSDALQRYAAVKPCSIVCTHLDENAADSTDLEELQTRGYGGKEFKDNVQKQREIAETLVELAEDLKDLESLIKSGGIGNEEDLPHKATAAQRAQYEKDIAKNKADQAELAKEQASIDTWLMNSGWDIHQPYYRSKVEQQLKRDEVDAYSFFISNKHYLGCKSEKIVTGGLLTLERTGIPELRAHILRMTAADELATMVQYIQDVDGFLRGLCLVARPEYAQANRAVLQTIEQQKQKVTQYKHGVYITLLESATTEHLSDSIVIHMRDFVNRAVKFVRELGAWHSASWKSFVAHNGSYKTKKHPQQTWNRKFFGKFAQVLLESWDAFTQAEITAFKLLQDALLKQVYGIIAKANKRGAEQLLEDRSGEFRALIENKVKVVERLCEEAKREYAIKLDANKIEATKPGGKTHKSYIDLAVEDAYDTAKLITGRGYVKNVVSLFVDHFEAKGNSSPFNAVSIQLKEQVEEDATAQLDVLIEGVEQIFDEIKGWLETVFAEEFGSISSSEIRNQLNQYLARTEKIQGVDTVVGAQENLKSISAEFEEIVKGYEK